MCVRVCLAMCVCVLIVCLCVSATPALPLWFPYSNLRGARAVHFIPKTYIGPTYSMHDAPLAALAFQHGMKVLDSGCRSQDPYKNQQHVMSLGSV